MKVLVICQYYFPEPFRVHDICEELVKRGHEVTVVTGEPNYPEGYIYKGYENHQKADEVKNGVTIHRCPIHPRKNGFFHRALNYFSYSRLAKKYVKNLKASDGAPFDLVFVYQLSPVMMAEPAIAYSKKYNVPVVLYCLDLWPESLLVGGVKKNLLIYKILHGTSKRIYRSANRILVTSRSFVNYFRDHFQIGEEKIEYLPQHAESTFEKLPYHNPEKEINLLFAGNIGAAQSVDTIIEAARKMQGQNVRFHIVGGGSELERLQEQAKDLSNVVFYGRCPVEEMSAFYSQADAMLVTLVKDPALSLTLPGKVQSYMAAQKPIIGAINGETAQVIREANCGFCGEAENADALVENIKAFIECPKKEELGSNARAFYERYFDKQIFINHLETVFNQHAPH